MFFFIVVAAAALLCPFTFVFLSNTFSISVNYLWEFPMFLETKPKIRAHWIFQDFELHLSVENWQSQKANPI